jgi:uncharacterized damage-inducible protein DinB
MITQTPWFERKFNFDFPVGLYPILLERMRGTHARIEEMVDDVSDKKLSKQVDGKWSVKDHIGHLSDLEELHMHRFREYMEGKETLSAADPLNQKTTGAKHYKKKLKRLMKNFRDSRKDFLQLLEKADDELISRKAIHPRLQEPMRLVDMIYFVCEHDDHHLAKMRSLISNS